MMHCNKKSATIGADNPDTGILLRLQIDQNSHKSLLNKLLQAFWHAIRTKNSKGSKNTK
jgi:hypothetical protein